jgi:hypothetical protein
MVDRSVWSVSDKRLVYGELTDQGVDLTGLEYFTAGEWWEDGLEGFGEHGLTTTWSSYHEDIVKSCSCDHESTFGCELSLDMTKI